ncbi:hypothetical protein [Sodalis-like endosymbiont of Proechinophthirus fluctus]|uniref:hypothetical protein n=1 Tax=Sodalis-like endosymbiont of Proechinophthirus fluctus TaxID=1462730 RepID=UPI000AA7160E|nr:hypothetical protein [Sodalis-like endosymbiont of Proechinophthirus fluctus]
MLNPDFYEIIRSDTFVNRAETISSLVREKRQPSSFGCAMKVNIGSWSFHQGIPEAGYN